MKKNVIIIDAAETSLGRIASYAAKQSLLGKEVKIVNCKNAIITGKRKSIVSEYKIARARGGSIRKGPHFPKSPERIMKRTVRGMLSYKQGRGRDAMYRVKCYNAIPEEFADQDKIQMKRPIKSSVLKLEELSKVI